jgi:hypothetical protein
MNCSFGTGFRARAAEQTAVLAVEEFKLEGLTLRVVTPPARERASAEKDGRPNAGSIVYGVLFDVEDRSAFHNKNILPVGESVNKDIQVVYFLYAGVK